MATHAKKATTTRPSTTIPHFAKRFHLRPRSRISPGNDMPGPEAATTRKHGLRRWFEAGAASALADDGGSYGLATTLYRLSA